MPYKFKTSVERSNLMRKIKSSRTTPELLLQKALRKEGVTFKKNYSALPGNPDIAVVNKKLAIFVDGEFWHGHCWKSKKRKLKANRAYWIPKIERTILRDKKNARELRKQGWKVVRFWQHQINKDLTKCICTIKKAIKKPLR